MLSEISFRRGSRSTAWTGSVNTRGVLDLEIYASHADHSQFSTSFKNNYLGTESLVMKRAKVNIPNTQQPARGPAPWNIRFPFDNVYAYDGQRDLLWEMRVHAVMSQAYFIEAHFFGQLALDKNIGFGCTATGQTNAMLQQFFYTGRPWSRDLTYSIQVFYGPQNANAGIGLGFQRANLTIGSWCTKVYTNPIFFWFGKTQTSDGVFTVHPSVVKWSPSFANATLFTQGFAADSRQPGGIALTQGLQTTIPALPASTEVASRLFTIKGTTTTATGEKSEGYGVTIRLSHR